MKNNQRNHTGMFMFLTQVKAVLFAIISATSYYWFLGSTPFEIALGVYGNREAVLAALQSGRSFSVTWYWACVECTWAKK